MPKCLAMLHENPMLRRKAARAGAVFLTVLAWTTLATGLARAEERSHTPHATSGFSTSMGQEPERSRALAEAGFWLFSGATGEMFLFSQPSPQQGHAWGIGASLGISLPIWRVFPEAALKLRLGYSPDVGQGVLELALRMGAMALVTRQWGARANYEWVVSTLASSGSYGMAAVGVVYLFD